ncbi:hypothetical protein [Aliarcobacter butzleri]|uniref:hypothetical protein n=1 Tax=Aliarcobacter butzleri TaxID=28197 RepID=UPI00344E810A
MKKYQGELITNYFLGIVCFYTLTYTLKINNLFFNYLQICLSFILIFWVVIILIKFLNNNRKIYLRLVKIFKCIDKNSFKLLFLFSLIWIIIAISLLLEDNILKNSLKILLIKPKSLNPNEWGDFLAGFVAPLAFIWIGFGVYYQKKEFANVVKSFNLQQKEFKKSVGVLEKQTIQIEIQRYHNWFNRNTNQLTFFLNKLSESQESQNNTPLRIYNDLKIQVHEKYFNIYDELKSIIDLDKYICNYLKSIKDNDIVLAIKDLEDEYKMLFEEHIIYSRKVLLKIYILICSSSIEYKDNKPFENYSIFFNWLIIDNIDLSFKIKTFIDEQDGIDIMEKIRKAFINIDENEKIMELTNG